MSEEIGVVYAELHNLSKRGIPEDAVYHFGRSVELNVTLEDAYPFLKIALIKLYQENEL